MKGGQSKDDVPSKAAKETCIYNISIPSGTNHWKIRQFISLYAYNKAKNPLDH